MFEQAYVLYIHTHTTLMLTKSEKCASFSWSTHAMNGYADLKQIIHDYGSVSHVGLNNIQESSTV